jgi:tetratricopeptide (TPR) repeat protein
MLPRALLVAFAACAGVGVLGPLVPALPAQSIDWWQKDLDGALAAAAEKPGKMVALYCWRDGNDACASMFGSTLGDKKVAERLQAWVCMGAKDDAAGKPLHERYRVTRVPTILFLQPDGQVADVVVGYVPVAEFVEELERITAGRDTIGALRERAAAAPKDTAAQLALALKLRAVGDRAGAAVAIEAVLALDPKFTTEAAAEAKLLELDAAIFRPEVAPADWDLKPLRAFLGKQKHKRIQFLGYDRLAAAEYARGELGEAADAAERAWKVIPPEHVIEWGQSVCGKAYENWQKLDKIDKGILKQALQVSKKTLEAVEKRHAASPDAGFLANALYVHAAVLIVNKQRKEAFAAMDRAIELDPKNENLVKAKERWVEGDK